MCARVQCERCNKPTFAGCGRHVEQVLGNVPPADRCRCAEEPMEHHPPESKGDWMSWLRRAARP